MLLLGLVLVCTIVVVVLLIREWRRPLDDGSRCRTCGYLIYGLPSSTCPECGNDVRAGRIHRAGVRWWRLGLVGLWTVVCLFGVGPFNTAFTGTWSLVQQITLHGTVDRPGCEGDPGIVHFVGDTGRVVCAPGTLPVLASITLYRGRSDPAPLVVAVPTWTVDGQALSEEMLIDWLGPAGEGACMVSGAELWDFLRPGRATSFSPGGTFTPMSGPGTARFSQRSGHAGVRRGADGREVRFDVNWSQSHQPLLAGDLLVGTEILLWFAGCAIIIRLRARRVAVA